MKIVTYKGLLRNSATVLLVPKVHAATAQLLVAKADAEGEPGSMPDSSLVRKKQVQFRCVHTSHEMVFSA